MPSEDSNREETRALVERCLDALEDGGEPAVDRILAAHPEHAPAVRERLAALGSAGLLEDWQDAGDVPGRLGDYRLLEPLGAGGMGVVYLAEQLSLGRRVALKLIRPERLCFDEARARFRREIETVARLDHPNIVRIHAVGEQHGVPFCAMEYVDGATLAEVLASLRRSGAARHSAADLGRVVAQKSTAAGGTESTSSFAGSWTDACFRIGRDVAAALAHAHGRGVLHRDVKPSNILLTPDGRVLLLDFGLAHASGSQELTRSGAQLGSLPYMAPEQVRGETRSVDERTDVYGLGVTLYEALTLRSPFGCGDDELTRRLILAGNPPSIAAARPDVPRDARTVCATAMAPEPERRYASMAAFAADLDGFLARRPVMARPAGPLLRAKRWVQRHPARAALAGLVAVAAIAGPAFWVLGNRIAATEVLADDRLEAAIAAVDILIEHSEQELANRPASDAARRELLERAVRLYERLLARETDRPELTVRVVEARVRIADLRRELGRTAEAEREVRRALETAAAMREADPTDRRALVAHADATLVLAKIEKGAGRLDAERARLESLLEELGADRAPRHPAVVERGAIAWQLLAINALGRGDIEAAEQGVQHARALFARLRDDVWTGPSELGWLANLEQNVGYAVGFYRRQRDYRPYFERAVEAQEQLIEAHGPTPGRREQLARMHGAWGQVATVRGQLESGSEHSRSAVELMRALTAEFPGRAGYAERELQFTHQLGAALERAGELDRAERVYREGIAASERVVERLPDVAAVLRPRAVLLTQLARLLGRRGADPDADLGREVAALWRDAETVWTRLVEVAPANTRYLAEFAVFLDNRARYVQQSGGSVELARALAETALQRHRLARARLPRRPEFPTRIGKTSLLLAALCTDAADRDAALAVLEQAVAEGCLTPEQIRGRAALVDRLGNGERVEALLGR